MKKFLPILKKPLGFFRKLSFKKKLIVFVAVIIILAILSRALGGNGESGYVLTKVEKTDVSETVSETGNVFAGATIDIVSPTTGIVEEVYVSNGQTVNQGDVLFSVKSTATEQEQAAAYSNYLAAASLLNAAQAQSNSLRALMYTEWDDFYNMSTSSNYETNDGDAREDERLAAEFQIAQDEWKAAEKRYKDQQTAIGQAQAQAASTWLVYEATQNSDVKATSDGTVSNLTISRGNSILANTVSALTIASGMQNQFVHITVSETDIAKINPGQDAIIKIDAIRDEEFKGEVARVDSIGTNTQGVITYNAYINLLVSDSRIRSGMTSNVEIATATEKNTLSVPNSAVKPYQGGRAVQILENGQPKHIPVRVGIRGRERTQILDGLIEGQEIITGARNELIQRESGFGF